MPREKSAGAVVFRKEPRRGTNSLRGRDSKIYYLLLHYQSGHWDFPKGHIEEGEREEETARREVAEETGIKDIRIIEGFKEWIKYFFRKTYNLEKEEKKKASWIFKIAVFYLVETKTKEVKISWEHRGYKWLPYDKALRQVTFKNAKEILKKANNFLTQNE